MADIIGSYERCGAGGCRREATWICQNMSKYVKICQNMSKYVKICQNMSKYVKIYQNISKYLSFSWNLMKSRESVWIGLMVSDDVQCIRESNGFSLWQRCSCNSSSRLHACIEVQLILCCSIDLAFTNHNGISQPCCVLQFVTPSCFELGSLSTSFIIFQHVSTCSLIPFPLPAPPAGWTPPVEHSAGVPRGPRAAATWMQLGRPSWQTGAAWCSSPRRGGEVHQNRQRELKTWNILKHLKTKTLSWSSKKSFDNISRDLSALCPQAFSILLRPAERSFRRMSNRRCCSSNAAAAVLPASARGSLCP